MTFGLECAASVALDGVSATSAYSRAVPCATLAAYLSAACAPTRANRRDDRHYEPHYQFRASTFTRVSYLYVRGGLVMP